ncbi:hybrid sensor histidine kinase/response regulator [Mariniblastus fucicola]|uniref:Chemotaxis protein CheA n=2 Tax=Pirellulaceae TaxID=2691357 RepID=A0A5B9PC27_9BACT|nr:response regulator [Mariniblastus fucicola]QEG20661.1 Chemotaxis protein CheA [Mariniblastus fucicola]
MNNVAEQLENAWAPIRESMTTAIVRDENALEKLALELTEFAHVSRTVGKEELSRGADQLARLADVSAVWLNRYPDDTEIVDEMMDFVESHLGELENGIATQETNPKIDHMIELANEAWSDYFIMTEGSWGTGLSLESEPAPTFSVESPYETELPSALTADEGDEIQTSALLENEIGMLLGAMTGASKQPVSPEPNPNPIVETVSESEPTAVENEPVAPVESDSEPAQETDVDEAAREELRADREMLDAYLDDSLRCVAAMEAAALSLDASPSDKESIRAFCRELHTLKGASATVGLAGLASHLHNLENSLEEIFSGNAHVNPETLFEAIDFVRKEMDLLNPESEPVSAKLAATQQQTQIHRTPDPQPAQFATVPNASMVSPVSASNSETPSPTSFASNDNSSIRIRAAQLDRLMDMLAELVVLRNRRENNASEFDLLYSELSRCSTRLSIVEEQAEHHSNNSVVGEVSKDIEAVGRGFRALQKPVANDNAAITRFIRDFRQELMHLRRVPVSGLFGRLQRAARDAAKKEKKQVRVKVAGENTGLEQEVQERLYESLLHVVRNSVSHGIQSPYDRAAAGKDEAGTITLEASASAQLLVIEVRDDGNGVNYEAIRQRGIEKGLIAANHQTTNAELANLIFHPGFSTKQTASEISGRGVGMDVVATTLEQMRGRIEVESVTGKGTTIRLLIPRRTGIEHVMVFRSHEQLYALPMQSVVAAKKSRDGFDSLAKLAFSNKRDRQSNNVLVVKCSGLSGDSKESRIAISVDELLGPEEVVVRGLPPMLRNHPLFCGITLSGSGEKVLLLETESVADYCIAESDVDARTDATDDSRLKALVVDDSITARKHISKLLKSNGFAVVEAGDGLDAIETLHRSNFELVVTDLDMPRLGGLELLADIRNGSYCSAPVIVVSSRDDAGFRQQALEYGARGFINKPVSKQQFQQQLEKLGLTLATCQE